MRSHVKHSIPITVLLIGLFFAAQLVGLVLLALDIEGITGSEGQLSVEHGTTAIGERPQTAGLDSLLYLVLGVAIGTILVLLLIRLKAYNVWKVWFLIAVWFSMTIALGVIMPAMAAFVICLAVAAWKVYYPNPYIHNLAEIFMYAGLAILLVPIFTLGWTIVLLLLISIYDIIAVWYSKHMVTMAQAQTKSNLFAGLYVPKNGTGVKAPTVETKISHAKRTGKVEMPDVPPPSAGNSAAILGGGDIAFPLIFTGVAMDWLIAGGMSVPDALLHSLIVAMAATGALAGLFMYAQKDRFYPAMPFLSIGCIVGLGLVVLII